MEQKWHTEAFRKAAVQKVLSRDGKSISELCDEIGIADSSFYKWRDKYANSDLMKKPNRRPKDWTAAEKFKAVFDYNHLPETERGEYLRREGLHSDNIAVWKRVMESSLDMRGTKALGTKGEISSLKNEVKTLQKDLNRKDRALAETTALLVLKKKADLIWGTGESE